MWVIPIPIVLASLVILAVRYYRCFQCNCLDCGSRFPLVRRAHRRPPWPLPTRSGRTREHASATVDSDAAEIPNDRRVVTDGDAAPGRGRADFAHQDLE